MKIEINAEGLKCPEPIMLLHKAVRESQDGDLIELTATIKSTERDVGKFCNFQVTNYWRKKNHRRFFIFLFKRKLRI